MKDQAILAALAGLVIGYHLAKRKGCGCSGAAGVGAATSTAAAPAQPWWSYSSQWSY